MAEGDIGAVIDSLEFDAGVIYFPRIVHVIGNIYAIAYRGPDDDGWLKTVEILPDGTVGAAVIDSLEFDTVKANYPDMLRIADDIVAIAYEDSAGDGWVKTYEILSDGTITDAIVDSLEFDTNFCTGANLIQIYETVYAVAYQAYTANPKVKTFTISAAGAISNTIIDELQWDTAGGYYPHIINVGDNMFAIAYQGESLDGYIATIGIAADGEIDAERTDKYEFDTVECSFPRIIHISEEIYAIAYTGSGGVGYLKTITISELGAITAAVIDSLEFDAVQGQKPDIIHVSGNIYVIAYADGSQDGWIKTIEILTNGTITDAIVDSLEFDAVQGENPSMLHISESVYAIAFKGPDSNGWVKTVGIETVAARAPNHLMIMGMG